MSWCDHPNKGSRATNPTVPPEDCRMAYRPQATHPAYSAGLPWQPRTWGMTLLPPLPQKPALWVGVDAMLACDGDALDSTLLRREAARMRDAVEACTHADVLGHGDLKPSNVLRLRRGGITFIDFELARPRRRRGRLRRLRNRADGVVDAIRFSLARRPARTTAATTSLNSFGRRNCRRRRTLLSCPSSRPTLATARRDAPPTRTS